VRIVRAQKGQLSGTGIMPVRGTNSERMLGNPSLIRQGEDCSSSNPATP
jgi:hypothetical protein